MTTLEPRNLQEATIRPPVVMVDLNALEPGDTVNATLSVRRSAGIKPYADGYLLTLVLGNATGRIPGKLWLGPDKDQARSLCDRYEPGTVVSLHATVTRYKGKAELSLQEPPALVDPDTIDPSTFVPGSDKHLGVLLRSLLDRARSLQDPGLKELVNQAWTQPFQADLVTAPATKKNHRAYRGGLLERVHAMVTVADALTDAYEDLDEDLLIAAILLHPLGVLSEHEVTTTIQITDEGRLLGPGTLTDQRLTRLLKDASVPDERALRLRHLLLALTGASGRSTVQPRTPEAVALNLIETLDARLARTLEAAKRMRDEGRSRGWADETRQFLDVQGRNPRPSPRRDQSSRSAPEPTR